MLHAGLIALAFLWNPTILLYILSVLFRLPLVNLCLTPATLDLSNMFHNHPIHNYEHSYIRSYYLVLHADLIALDCSQVCRLFHLPAIFLSLNFLQLHMILLLALLPPVLSLTVPVYSQGYLLFHLPAIFLSLNFLQLHMVLLLALLPPVLSLTVPVYSQGYLLFHLPAIFLSLNFLQLHMVLLLALLPPVLRQTQLA